MSEEDTSRVAFEQWVDDYALRSEPNYSKATEADCFAAWQASRKQALEEAAEVCDLAITQNNETEAKLIGLEKLVSRGAEMQAKKLAETIRSLK